jgi:hypothetical protein
MGFFKSETAKDRRINFALAIAIEALRRLPEEQRKEMDILYRSGMAELLDRRVGDDEKYLSILQAEAASVLSGHPFRQLELVGLTTWRTLWKRLRKKAISDVGQPQGS